MRTYAVLSRMLDYPDEELLAHTEDIQSILVAEDGLSDRDRGDIVEVLAWMSGMKLLELQQNYVATFDNRSENSLHLTHHLFGEDDHDRGRGPAMINLGEHYKKAGLEAKQGELPDFLPLLLEYAATLEKDKAGPFLGDACKVLTVLAANLEKEESPYAPLIRLLERHGKPFCNDDE